MGEPIYFNSKIEEYAWLSNFAPSPIVDKKNAIWPTAEHAFQGQKTLEPDWKAYIRGAKAPWIARKYGKNAPLRSDWHKVKVDMMRRILVQKFAQNDDIRERLLDTKDAKLIHEAPWDGFWGTGPSGDGKNMLGVIIMEIRDGLLEDLERGDESDGAGDREGS